MLKTVYIPLLFLAVISLLSGASAVSPVSVQTQFDFSTYTMENFEHLLPNNHKAAVSCSLIGPNNDVFYYRSIVYTLNSNMPRYLQVIRFDLSTGIANSAIIESSVEFALAGCLAINDNQALLLKSDYSGVLVSLTETGFGPELAGDGISFQHAFAAPTAGAAALPANALPAPSTTDPRRSAGTRLFGARLVFPVKNGSIFGVVDGGAFDVDALEWHNQGMGALTLVSVHSSTAPFNNISCAVLASDGDHLYLYAASQQDSSPLVADGRVYKATWAEALDGASVFPRDAAHMVVKDVNYGYYNCPMVSAHFAYDHMILWGETTVLGRDYDVSDLNLKSFFIEKFNIPEVSYSALPPYFIHEKYSPSGPPQTLVTSFATSGAPTITILAYSAPVDSGSGLARVQVTALSICCVIFVLTVLYLVTFAGGLGVWMKRLIRPDLRRRRAPAAAAAAAGADGEGGFPLAGTSLAANASAQMAVAELAED